MLSLVRFFFTFIRFWIFRTRQEAGGIVSELGVKASRIKELKNRKKELNARKQRLKDEQQLERIEKLEKGIDKLLANGQDLAETATGMFEENH